MMSEIPAIRGMIKSRISEKFWSIERRAHFPPGIVPVEPSFTGSIRPTVII